MNILRESDLQTFEQHRFQNSFTSSMAATIIRLDNAEEYDWGEGCKGWHLVNNPGISVIREMMPPDTNEVRHYHTRSWQFFYVLSGRLVIEVDNVINNVAAGQGLEVRPGEAHQVMNQDRVEAEFLVCSMPPSHGDRTESDPSR